MTLNFHFIMQWVVPTICLRYLYISDKVNSRVAVKLSRYFSESEANLYLILLVEEVPDV